MFRPLPFLLASILLLGAASPAAAEPPPHRALTGEIEGAHWAAMVPENWDGRLLLEAPDSRNATVPPVATLDATDPATDALLAVGWAVATTSYRRHGPLIADGIADLRALRDHLVAELGQPKLTLVEGTGMGGLIALFIAERHADEFHGCIARNPPLDLHDPRAPRLHYDHQPRAPLLLLATPDAVAPVQDYIARARTAANAESVAPVFWFVPEEATTADKAALQLDSLATMEEWARTRQSPDDRPPPPEPKATTDQGTAGVPSRAPMTDAPAQGPAPFPADPSAAPTPETAPAPTPPAQP